MTATVYDSRRCELGEGPLWHPERQQLFWFDILGKRLLSRENGTEREWRFGGDCVSAAGWVNNDQMLIASENELFLYDLETEWVDHICPLEANDPETRSNDGRADPQGGFWIGTMAKRGFDKPGAIYRYYRGELRLLFPGIRIPNAISFSPDGTLAYFTDTPDARIMAQPLDGHGWPKGEPRVFADLRAEGLHPDGSVVDASGNMWNAQYAAGRVAVYGPDGAFRHAVAIPGKYSTCPAFGGAGLSTLFCTSAHQDIDAKTLAKHPENGQTFAIQTHSEGQKEHRVIL